MCKLMVFAIFGLKYHFLADFANTLILNILRQKIKNVIFTVSICQMHQYVLKKKLI